MRILRLRLKNFRGVAEREVEFLPRGVTVIQGPNEVGKSSLAEAIDLLFDFRSDSKSRRVKAVQPVGRDVGSEVEIEVSMAQTHFVYFKRFNRDPETRLNLLSPVAESWVGREAHDKAIELLEGSMDVALWKALRVQQGVSLEPAAVHGSKSLAAALDRAAQVQDEGGGSSRAAAREEGLFARVERQYERYYTPGKGQERGEIKAARRQVEKLEAEVDRLDDELAELESELEEMDRLLASAGELRQAARKAESDAAKHSEALVKVELMTVRLKALERRQRESAEREKLWAQLAKLKAEEVEHAARAATLEERVQGETAALEPLEERLRQAKDQVTLGAEILALRRRDETHFAVAQEARQLRATAQRVAEANRRVDELEQRLSEFWIDSDRLAPIEQAERAVATAQGALAGGSPRLRVKALADLEMEIDGEARPLAAGERLDRQIDAGVRLRVEEVAEIEIEPGEGVEELRSALSQRRWELERRCSEAGVASAEEARVVAGQRRQVEVELSTAKAARKRALDGEDAEQVEELLTQLEGELSAYLEARRSQPPLAEDAEAARAVREAAEAAVDEARLRLDECRQACDEGLRGREEMALALREATAAAARVEQQMDWVRGQLADVGEVEVEGGGDGDLSVEERARQAARAASRAASEAREAAVRLEDEQPEMVRVLAERSRAAKRGKNAELVGTERRLHGLEERLKALGEQGLQEARDDAAQRLAAATRRRDDLLRRAAAAGLLYRVMSAARAASRAAYLGPLKERIEALGRRLHGQRFAVELDDELRIRRRILDGTALPIEALSAGAQEQLSILFRLACTLLVSPDGGVPLILDDSLGHADPRRLAAMAEVLNEAGRQCQVLILTAWPERFEAVTAARRINLKPAD